MSNADRIKELREEADRLEAADKAFDKLPEEHRLAVTLHGMLCRHNHVDGCSWEYENGKNGPNWHSHAHSYYLEKALMVVGACRRLNIKTEDAVQLFRIVKDL